MSNPQVESLRKLGRLAQVQQDIIEILKKYASVEMPLCSHEILGLAGYETIISIAQGIKPGNRGYSIPSSWVGSVAADMANKGIINQVNKICNYNKHNDEAWYV
ncbi:MAG: hypothetical protein GX640_25085 [Fibrobacter sp.]|nr:hypothetical protein [Fibrobacter sp.]